METTELGFTKAELIEDAISFGLIDGDEDLTLEELQDMLSSFAGDIV